MGVKKEVNGYQIQILFIIWLVSRIEFPREDLRIPFEVDNPKLL